MPEILVSFLQKNSEYKKMIQKQILLKKKRGGHTQIQYLS